AVGGVPKMRGLPVVAGLENRRAVEAELQLARARRAPLREFPPVTRVVNHEAAGAGAPDGQPVAVFRERDAQCGVAGVGLETWRDLQPARTVPHVEENDFAVVICRRENGRLCGMGREIVRLLDADGPEQS